MADKYPYRPLRPEETHVNPQTGQRQSEVTRTVKIDSHWVNVPSLWVGPSGKPISFERATDDMLATFAKNFEKNTGLQFKRWSSEPRSVSAAIQRSNAGGANAPGSRYINDRHRIPPGPLSLVTEALMSAPRKP